jgi:hypothetical protein
MARKATKSTQKNLDIMYMGREPDLSKGVKSQSEIIQAWNWYNYFHDSDKAKEFVLAYLKQQKASKEAIKNVSRIPAHNLNSIGWTCRILTNGGKLPKELVEKTFTRLGTLSKQEAQNLDQDVLVPVEVKPVISIQERVNARTSDLVAELESQIDAFITNGESAFKVADWLRSNEVKPAIAQRIADYYKPLYSELFDAIAGKDEDLKEGYARWKKPKLKAYMELIKSIVSESESRAIVIKAVKKPRKKKEKPASVIVAKVKYKEKDDEFGIVSESPVQILGSNQVWVFNTKYRTLSVYNAMGPAGLGVKGTSLTGYDEKTSVTKKLRKPQDQIATLMQGGKIVMRKFMDEVKCKPREASGRINTDTVILRIVK